MLLSIHSSLMSEPSFSIFLCSLFYIQKVMSSSGLTTGVVMSGGAGIGLQGSCPDHYSEFKGNCYSRIFGKMMDYGQADAKCSADGAALATITSQEENDYITQMMYQRPGWIGLSNKDIGAFQWDDWVNWGPGEPNSRNGFLNKLPAQGSATGDVFNDQNAGVRVCVYFPLFLYERIRLYPFNCTYLK